MILVTTGTNRPFERLLRAVERLGSAEEIVVQTGASAFRPRNARCVPYLPYGELAELIGEARAVVTHGGVGSILTALRAGKRPYVVPRLARLDECVDDHQLELAQALARAGLVALVHEPLELGAALAQGSDRSSGAVVRGDGALARDLAAYLADAVAPAARGR